MADAAQRAAFAGAPPSPCQAPTTLTLSEPALAAQAEDRLVLTVGAPRRVCVALITYIVDAAQISRCHAPCDAV